MPRAASTAPGRAAREAGRRGAGTVRAHRKSACRRAVRHGRRPIPALVRGRADARRDRDRRRDVSGGRWPPTVRRGYPRTKGTRLASAAREASGRPQLLEEPLTLRADLVVTGIGGLAAFLELAARIRRLALPREQLAELEVGV